MSNKIGPLLSAIVTNYNGWELGLLKDFFESFLKNDYKNFEIFLVDMSSSDGSVDNVKKYFGGDKRLRVIINPKNNMSAGINMAMKECKGKYILFLNNDIYFQKGAIRRMIQFMDKRPDTGQIQGKVVSYYNHKKIDSVGESMDVFGNPATLGVGEEDCGQYDEIREVLSVTGSSAMYRARLVNEIGVLDSDYGIGYEDMDLSLRLRLSGYKIFCVPEALVYHRRASSTSKAPAKLKAEIKYWFNKNRLTTIVKNYSTINIIKTLPVVLTIYIASGFFEIFYKKLWRFGLSRFRAIVWLFMSIPALIEKRFEIQRKRKFSDEEVLVPFMVKNRIMQGFKGFLGSKSW